MFFAAHRRAFTLLAAAVVFYALVCPVAPTPMGVTKGKHLDLAAAVAPMLMATVTVLLVPSILSELPPFHDSSTDILALTCARTC